MVRRNKIKEFFAAYQKEFVKLWLMMFALFSALLVAPVFKLPYANPHGISNPYNSIGVNPSNNYIVMLATVVLTVVFFYLLMWLYNSKYASILKLVVTLVLMSSYFVSGILTNHAGNSAGQGDLNIFHVGEQLSPAMAYLQGSQLYTDIIFLRGAGVDVLFPALGLLLFGKTIGAFIFISDLYRLLAFGVFAWLLARIFKHPIVYSLVLLAFFIANGVSVFELRDVFAWLVFALVLYAFAKSTNTKYANYTLLMMGTISSLSLYASVDRGILLFSAAVLLAFVLPFFKRGQDGTYKLTKGYLVNVGQAIYLLAGLMLGLFAPILSIGLDGFAAFVKLTFHDIPLFGGLLVSMPMPGIFSPMYQMWGPALVAIVALLLYIQLALKHRAGGVALNYLIPLGFMLMYSLVCLKMGTNRIDINKMATVTAPLFLTAVALLAYTISLMRARIIASRELVMLAALLVAVILIFSRIDIARLAVNYDYSRAQLKAYAMTPRHDDTYWLTWEMNETTKVIRNNTQTNDYIYAFTSDPMYYYLTGRKNPGKMYINWYNDPQPYTDELMADMKAKQPKIIIYSEQTWMDSPDNISMAERLPEINEWILSNYPIETTVGKTTLRSKTALN